MVELSHPVVEAGIFEADTGTALILANFQYARIPELIVTIPLRKAPKKVTSMEKGNRPFTLGPSNGKQSATGFTTIAKFKLPLGWNDIVTVE